MPICLLVIIQKLQLKLFQKLLFKIAVILKEQLIKLAIPPVTN